ncbi:DEKNAAC104494 [Brettanomyces naardenensis]|uniref:DEKNAAC104494 n=1 Tax=Brettanomyces naardenensis TaxID=13370 RepID=A0A448YR66_BRENA|nr:DEKNAAC104494 [Brettanomyces naardenensis]
MGRRVLVGALGLGSHREQFRQSFLAASVFCRQFSSSTGRRQDPGYETIHNEKSKVGETRKVPEKGSKPRAKKRRKTWMERYFGLTVEQQNEAGFGEVKRLLQLAKRDSKLFAVAIFLLVISAAIVMALPKITGSILDATREYSTLQDIQLFGLSLNQFLLAMAGLLLLSTFTTFGRIIILRVLGEKLVARLRSRIMKKTLRQDMSFFDENKVGDLISRLSSDAYVVSRSVTQNLSDGIKHSIVGASSITMMFILSPKLSLILLAFGPPLVFASYIYGLKIRAISRELQQSTGSLTKVAEEQLNSIKTIQSFTAESKELHRYDNQIRDVFRISYKDALTNATFFASTGIMGNITFLLTLGVGTYFVMGGAMTVGDLTAYLMYTEYCGSATFGIANFYTELFKGAGAASRLFELLDKEPLIDEVTGEKITSSKGHIKFEDVCFKYPTRPDNEIFHNLNFEIKAGSNVCIVGPSGRGKSTIASLLLRFYNPDSGKITIDGEDITKYSVHSIRQIIGFVQQEPVLMPGTIRDNIKYGMPPNVKVTGDMIEWAAAKANCDFINQLPDRYDTDIGPRGSLLSGGQKQKVAIARCLIKEPSVMLLDEATSALDSKSENAINTTLTRLLRGHSMTTISIAHRLSTIERCDEVLVLGYDGQIVEQGKFAELYADEASRLYKLLNEVSKKDVLEQEEEKKRKEHEVKVKEEQALKDCKDKPTVLSKEELEKKELEDRELFSESFREETDALKDVFRQKLIIPQHMGNEDVVMQVAADREEVEKDEALKEQKKKDEEDKTHEQGIEEERNEQPSEVEDIKEAVPGFELKKRPGAGEEEAEEKEEPEHENIDKKNESEQSITEKENNNKEEGSAQNETRKDGEFHVDQNGKRNGDTGHVPTKPERQPIAVQ